MKYHRDDVSFAKAQRACIDLDRVAPHTIERSTYTEPASIDKAWGDDYEMLDRVGERALAIHNGRVKYGRFIDGAKTREGAVRLATLAANS